MNDIDETFDEDTEVSEEEPLADEESEHRDRISILNGGAMITTAVIIDVVQALIHIIDIGVITVVISVALNFLIEAGAWIGFYIWFRACGVSFVGPRQLLTFIGMGAGEIATAGILPAWTIGIFLLFTMTRAEDLIKRRTGRDIDLTALAKKPSLARPKLP